MSAINVVEIVMSRAGLAVRDAAAFFIEVDFSEFTDEQIESFPFECLHVYIVDKSENVCVNKNNLLIVYEIACFSTHLIIQLDVKHKMCSICTYVELNFLLIIKQFFKRT